MILTNQKTPHFSSLSVFDGWTLNWWRWIISHLVSVLFTGYKYIVILYKSSRSIKWELHRKIKGFIGLTGPGVKYYTALLSHPIHSKVKNCGDIKFWIVSVLALRIQKAILHHSIQIFFLLSQHKYACSPTVRLRSLRDCLLRVFLGSFPKKSIFDVYGLFHRIGGQIFASTKFRYIGEVLAKVVGEDYQWCYSARTRSVHFANCEASEFNLNSKHFELWKHAMAEIEWDEIKIKLMYWKLRNKRC